MVSASSISNSPPVTNPVLSAQIVTASDRASTARITPVAVSAPLQDERVNDNNSGRTVIQFASQAAESPASGESRSTGNGGDSTAFLTQLLSQSAAEQSDTAGISVSRFAPALQYNTLVGYGYVKYKPSDAGVPSSRVSANTSPEALAGESLNPSAASEYRAYNTTQSRNASELKSSGPPLMIAG